MSLELSDTPGEIELSFMRTFCRGSNLKSLMSRDGLPGILEKMQTLFRQFFGTDFSASLMSELSGATASDNCGDSTPTFTGSDRERLSDGVYVQLIRCLNAISPTLQYQLQSNSSVHCNSRQQSITRAIVMSFSPTMTASHAQDKFEKFSSMLVATARLDPNWRWIFFACSANLENLVAQKWTWTRTESSP